MIYLITCRKCDFSTNTDNPKKVKFCGGCGSLLRAINAKDEQPFHLEDKDVQELMKAHKALKECNDILKRINEKDSSNREETQEILGNVKEDSKDQMLTRQEWLSNDPELYRELKKL